MNMKCSAWGRSQRTELLGQKFKASNQDAPDAECTSTVIYHAFTRHVFYD